MFGTNNPIIREKKLSENLVLTELAKKGLGIESSAQFGSTMMRVKEEPVFAVNGGNTSREAKVWRSPSHSEERKRSCYKCGGRFPHDHQGCPAAGYKCEICLRYGHYQDFCNQQIRGKGKSRLIGTQRGGWRGERDQRGGYRGDRARTNHVIDEEKEQIYNDAAQEDEKMQLLQAVTDSDLYVFAASDLSKFKKGRISVLIDNKVPVKLFLTQERQ